MTGNNIHNTRDTEEFQAIQLFNESYGLSFSINDFGKSAPYKKVYDHFGLNIEKICKKIKLNIKKNAN